MMRQLQSPDTLKEHVRTKYGRLAEENLSCCTPDADTGACMSEGYGDIDGYEPDSDLSLGCGLPTEYANLQPGETVLDLGSGAGVDAFVARRAVGSEGRVLGVDMTKAMVEKARRNARKLGYSNVAFRLGEIESLPYEDASVDIVISNCVLNLVPDKQQAFREIYRVLRPGGRFCISDIVSSGRLPAAIREAAALHAGCISGAIPRKDYLEIVASAGFSGLAVANERVIDLPDETLRPHLSQDEVAAFRASKKGLVSVTVTGSKPAV